MITLWAESTLTYSLGTKQQSCCSVLAEKSLELRGLRWVVLQSWRALGGERCADFDLEKFSPGPGLKVNRVEARQEVIVSAGALNTPKLLQLSGIGPAFLTSQHGILSIIDLPGVGANLQDHPFGLMLASCKCTGKSPVIWKSLHG